MTAKVLFWCKVRLTVIAGGFPIGSGMTVDLYLPKKNSTRQWVEYYCEWSGKKTKGNLQCHSESQNLYSSYFLGFFDPPFLVFDFSSG
jgi:hypothetical protein